MSAEIEKTEPPVWSIYEAKEICGKTERSVTVLFRGKEMAQVLTMTRENALELAGILERGQS